MFRSETKFATRVNKFEPTNEVIRNCVSYEHALNMRTLVKA